MPFTSPAGLHTGETADGAPAVPGYAVVFESYQAGWIVDWYDDATGIQLPPIREWLAGAREEHRWFAAFVPARGERTPPVEDGDIVHLELRDRWHRVERIGRLRWAPGSTPWVILAGTDDPPAEPEQYADG
jgi:hypothetical protein